jgi:hypothetical protein
MTSTLAVILSFCLGFWLSAQFHEKEFEPNNEFIRKLFIIKVRKKKPEKLAPKEVSHSNDSPYNLNSATSKEGEE